MIDNVWAGKTAELEQQRQLELASAAGKSGGSVVRLSEKSFGVAQAAMECSLHIFFREFCPTSEHAVFRHPITGFACGPVRVQLTSYQGHFRDKERARGI